MTTESRIHAFNTLTAKDLSSTSNVEPILRDFHETHPDLRVTIFQSDKVSDQDISSCCDLVRDNLKDMYEKSSWGWDEDRKYGEMIDPAARFIMIKDNHSPNPKLLAFLSFQVADEEDEVVVYCYEVQLQPSLRNRGIGSRLMAIVEGIAADHHIHTVMLTVFTANVRAKNFYVRLGYGMDPSNPKARILRGRKVFADYMIMSKALKDLNTTKLVTR